MWGSMGFDGEGSKKLMEWGGPWHISQSGVFGPFGRFGPFETVVVCSFLKFFFFFFLLCVLYIGFYAWAWAQPFPISSKYLWFLGKKLHELGKIVNNCNLETYRGIKINNLRADSISPIVSLLWKRKLHTGRNFNHRHTRA